ncbi:MAG: hypothetical protein JNJ81_03255 [Candidatus Accumulibacter sp.]|nr:hypothetical protein [Accumulibacter sp.]
MKTPMILPWLAGRAGVSDSRAEELWRVACREAALLTGERDSSPYWGMAQQILLALLEQERWQAYPLLVWPWLLMQGGLQRWSVLTRRWLLPLLRACRPLQSGRPR